MGQPPLPEPGLPSWAARTGSAPPTGRPRHLPFSPGSTWWRLSQLSQRGRARAGAGAGGGGGVLFSWRGRRTRAPGSERGLRVPNPQHLLPDVPPGPDPPTVWFPEPLPSWGRAPAHQRAGGAGAAAAPGPRVGRQDVIGHVALLPALVPNLPPLALVIQDLGEVRGRGSEPACLQRGAGCPPAPRPPPLSPPARPGAGPRARCRCGPGSHSYTGPTFPPARAPAPLLSPRLGD